MSNNNIDDKFDFDHWAKLALDKPHNFELARQQMIDALIESMPLDRQQRLRGLQWQIDHVRERAPNALQAADHIAGMMWEKVLGENGLLDNLEQLSGRRAICDQRKTSAAVLPFKRD